MKQIDFIDCPECDGSGEILSETPYISTTSQCPTCKGTGKIAEVTHDNDVPEGYKFDPSAKAYMENCYVITGEQHSLEIELPNPIGTEIDVECNACGGKGGEQKVDRYITPWGERIEQKYFLGCSKCKGKTPKAKLDSVKFRDGKLIERWVKNG